MVNAPKQDKSFTEVQESQWGDEDTCKAVLYLKSDLLGSVIPFFENEIIISPIASLSYCMKKKKPNKKQNLEIVSEKQS